MVERHAWTGIYKALALFPLYKAHELASDQLEKGEYSRVMGLPKFLG